MDGENGSLNVESFCGSVLCQQISIQLLEGKMVVYVELPTHNLKSGEYRTESL